MKLKFNIWALAIFCAAQSSTCLPAPIEPLNQVPDAVGQSLQQHMIWAAPDAKLSSAFVAFRKKFSLADAPTKANLHLFADIRYVLWINGRYVSRGPVRFVPGGPEYDSDDVTSYLQPGDNEVVVLVLANQSNGKMMHHAPGLAVQLEITGTKGNQTVIVTDPTWKWSDQTRYRTPQVDWGNELDVIDSTVEDGDWTRLDYNDGNWRNAAKIDGKQWGALSACRLPLLQETPLAIKLNNQDYPVTISAGQQASFKLDHMVQAYTLIDFDADTNTSFELPYAQISYKAKPGRQIYISTDTHGIYGGAINVVSGKITIHSFKLVERIYPFECVGSFNSSDPLLNKLWKVCARSLQVMSEDAYIDCADRERTEWMDCTPPDFEVTRTAMAGPGTNGSKIYGDPRLLEEMLRRTALTLQPGGWVKAHTCSDRFDIHAKMEDRACDWVEGARLYYEATGNAAPIREIWPAMIAQMNYFLDRRSSRGLVIAREWVIWGNPMGYQTSEGAGLNAFVYKALVDAAYLGKVIGQTQDAEKLDHAAKDLSAAFNHVLWDEQDGTYYSGYDTERGELPPGVDNHNLGLPSDWRLPPKPPTLDNHCIAPTVFPALFALDQGIVPAERRAQVMKYLLAQPDPKPHIMFYYYYWKQLYSADQAGMDKRILDAMRQKWDIMANWPWQTTWEEFDAGSKAHCYGMFPGYFLSAYVLGVRRDEPVAAKQLLIEPHLGDLTKAAGVVVSEFGPVPVSWEQSANQLNFSFTVPAGVRTTVHLPKTSDTNTLILNGVTLVNKGVLSGGVTVTGRWFTLDVPAGTNTGTLTMATAPADVTSQPGGGLAFPGESFSFTVSANGQHLSYQWQKNSTDLPNSTNSILALTNLTLSDAGDYQMVISNPGGVIKSAVAMLQVVQPRTNILYLDYFSGAAGALNNRTPDTDAIYSNKWIAANAWRTDGTRANIANATANAFLPFVPEAGQVYRLSADINCVGADSMDWLSLGFANGTNTEAAWQLANNAVGWMLARDSGTVTADGQTFLGPGNTSSTNTGVHPTGTMNYVIILDTRPAQRADWTFTFLVNSNVVVPATTFRGDGPTISSIGLGMLSGGGSGQVDNFNLLKLSPAARP